MAATNGTMLLLGASGKTYSVDMYIPDAVATKVTFNGSGLAASTSEDYWSVPEPCRIIDISAVGAPTAVGAIFTLNGAQYSNECIRWANQANSLATRPPFSITIPAGAQLGMLQF
jgi:hypothetical protein